LDLLNRPLHSPGFVNARHSHIHIQYGRTGLSTCLTGFLNHHMHMALFYVLSQLLAGGGVDALADKGQRLVMAPMTT
jgi:hypothetical protein